MHKPGSYQNFFLIDCPFTFWLFLENESTPRQQLLEHFLRLLQRWDPAKSIFALCHLIFPRIWIIWGQSFCLNRKDQHGFFAFPVTDAIAPGYSMIIKHPMDFSTMKDKIAANEYKTITEFKVRKCPATIFIFRFFVELLIF